MAKISVTGKTAIDFEGVRNLLSEALQSEIARYVREELDMINELSPEDRTRFAIVFGVFSPQADFRPNVAIVRPIVSYVLAGGRDYDDIFNICKTHGYNMLYTNSPDPKINACLTLAEAIVSGQLPTWNELVDISGIGPKVASMITALADETAPVCTLDTWMLGGMLTLSQCMKLHQDNNYSISQQKSKKGVEFSHTNYRTLAEQFVNIAADLGTTPFHAQWTFWCYVRGNKMESHTPIFGL